MNVSLAIETIDAVPDQDRILSISLDESNILRALGKLWERGAIRCEILLNPYHLPNMIASNLFGLRPYEDWEKDTMRGIFCGLPVHADPRMPSDRVIVLGEHDYGLAVVIELR